MCLLICLTRYAYNFPLPSLKILLFLVTLLSVAPAFWSSPKLAADRSRHCRLLHLICVVVAFRYFRRYLRWYLLLLAFLSQVNWTCCIRLSFAVNVCCCSRWSFVCRFYTVRPLYHGPHVLAFFTDGYSLAFDSVSLSSRTRFHVKGRCIIARSINILFERPFFMMVSVGCWMKWRVTVRPSSASACSTSVLPPFSGYSFSLRVVSCQKNPSSFVLITAVLQMHSPWSQLHRLSAAVNWLPLFSLVRVCLAGSWPNNG